MSERSKEELDEVHRELIAMYRREAEDRKAMISIVVREALNKMQQGLEFSERYDERGRLIQKLQRRLGLERKRKAWWRAEALRQTKRVEFYDKKGRVPGTMYAPSDSTDLETIGYGCTTPEGSVGYGNAAAESPD